jgi:hypothetical protein
MITSLATLQNGEKKEKKENPALSPSKSKISGRKNAKIRPKRRKKKNVGPIVLLEVVLLLIISCMPVSADSLACECDFRRGRSFIS